MDPSERARIGDRSATWKEGTESIVAKRKLQFDQLVINSQYEEPSTYWSYDREVRMVERKDGRRPALYTLATPGAKSCDDPGAVVELPLVNQSRPRVAVKIIDDRGTERLKIVEVG